MKLHPPIKQSRKELELTLRAMGFLALGTKVLYMPDQEDQALVATVEGYKLRILKETFSVQYYLTYYAHGEKFTKPVSMLCKKIKPLEANKILNYDEEYLDKNTF